MGRKKYEPTDDDRSVVSELSRVGFNQELIAQKLGISKPTLEKYFRQELDFAAMDMVGSVGSALYANAMAGNVQAQIFIMKARGPKGCWRETERIEHTGADGAPLDNRPVLIMPDWVKPGDDDGKDGGG